MLIETIIFIIFILILCIIVFVCGAVYGCMVSEENQRKLKQELEYINSLL